MKKKKINLPTSGTNLEEDLENKKKTLGGTEKKILIVSSIAVLLTFIIGASYAYIAYTTRQKEINVLETNCINVTMEELTNEIRLTNAYPLTDENGMQTKPFRFKLTNTCGVGVDYNLNLEVMDTENRIAARNIAVKVDENAKSILNSNPSATPTYKESDYTAVESYTTYSGSINPYDEVTHEIRIWLDESAGNDSQNGTFYSKVVIEAKQNQIAGVIFEVGDYISYTPSSTSYKISTAMTGYSAEQTINPSELNLWRVIRENEDGTVDCVSENVSSNAVIFSSSTGYSNLVSSLNQIASAYETEGITSGSYHVGGSAGGYTVDTDLINSTFGSLISYLPNTTTANSYWLAAINKTYSGDRWEYQNGLYISNKGVVSSGIFVTYRASSSGVWSVDSVGSLSASIRPIITLKSKMTASGDGTIEDPYKLN